MPVSSASQTQYSRQTGIAVENSRVAVHRSNVMVNANKQALHSMHVALRKSIDAIAVSQDALSQQTQSTRNVETAQVLGGRPQCQTLFKTAGSNCRELFQLRNGRPSRPDVYSYSRSANGGPARC